jgi:hypothetical protein
MKTKLAISTALVTGILILSALPTFGASSATVPMSVSVQAPCITVDLGTATKIDFGSQGFSYPPPTGGLSIAQNSTPKVINCGSGSEDVFVKSTNAAGSGTGAWSLEPTFTWVNPVDSGRSICDFGSNKFALGARMYNGTNLLSTQILNVTTTDQKLFQAGPSSGSPVPSYRAESTLIMPCIGSSGGGETMSFQLTYTASL